MQQVARGCPTPTPLPRSVVSSAHVGPAGGQEILRCAGGSPTPLPRFSREKTNAMRPAWVGATQETHGGKGGHAPHYVKGSSPIIRTKISVNLPPYSCPLGLSGAPDNSAD